MSGTTPDGSAGPGGSSASIRLGTVVLDCPDPHALARFYAGLLGQPVDPDGDDDWQSLAGNGSGQSRTTVPSRTDADGRPGPAEPFGVVPLMRCSPSVPGRRWPSWWPRRSSSRAWPRRHPGSPG